MRLHSAEAVPLIAAASAPDGPAETWLQARALKTLEAELIWAHRLGWGLVAVLALVIGGFLAGTAVALMADDSVGGGVALGLVGLAPLAVGGWLGWKVRVAGKSLVDAYCRWARASKDSTADPASIYPRLLSGRGLLRGAISAGAVICAAFAWSLFGLGLATSDPAELGTGQGFGVVFGLVCGVTFTAVACLVFGGDLRTGLAHSSRVVAGRR